MGKEGDSYKHGERGNTKASNERHGYDGGGHYKNVFSGHRNYQSNVLPRASFVSKQMDPETDKYISEIVNLLACGVDMDERIFICGNALKETRGKELELTTDYYISHYLQTLL